MYIMDVLRNNYQEQQYAFDTIFNMKRVTSKGYRTYIYILYTLQWRDINFNLNYNENETNILQFRPHKLVQ